MRTKKKSNDQRRKENTIQKAIARLHSPPARPISFIQGNHHQGSSVYGHAAGKQCMCASTAFLCIAKLSPIAQWNPTTIDYVVMQGSLMYEALHPQHTYLLVSELPHRVEIEETVFETNVWYFKGQMIELI